MSEILLCDRTYSASAFKNECGIDIKLASSLACPNPNMIIANTPYLLKNGKSAIGATSLAKQSNPSITKNMTELALSFGGDNLIALSSINAQLQDYNVGLIGASAGVYVDRIGGFVGSVKNYQAAIMEYRQTVKTNSSFKAAAKQKAKAAYNKMQNNFRHEIKMVTSQVKPGHSAPLNNFDRTVRIARSKARIAKLNVVTPIQANNIVKFTKYAKFLGDKLVLIEFGSRVGNIHNSYQAGGNWEREMFIESSSFAASAATGIGVANAGLALLVFATPFGWMALVGGGLVVASVAAGASMGMNYAVKNNSGSWYDSIIKSIGAL